MGQPHQMIVMLHTYYVGSSFVTQKKDPPYISFYSKYFLFRVFFLLGKKVVVVVVVWSQM